MTFEESRTLRPGDVVLIVDDKVYSDVADVRHFWEGHLARVRETPGHSNLVVCEGLSGPLRGVKGAFLSKEIESAGLPMCTEYR